ncbi:MAG: hypothetical protein K0R85_390 [Devosia sp.]|jgi:hypothetical protein|nr:hypothetical protein [Devosia sp.]
MRRTPARKRELKIEGAWIPHRLEMLTSDAWKALSPVGRQVLDRLEVEHMQHAGTENGNLPCTYADLEAYGVRRRSIPDALRQLDRLGFIRVEERGRGGNAEFRRASRYRLTYVGASGAPPTDDWKRYRRPGLSSQDIDSRGENAPACVGAETPPKMSSVRGGNAPGAGAKTPLAF